MPRSTANSSAEKGWQYGKGLQSATLNLPGVKDAADYFQTQQYNKNQTAQEAKDETGVYVTDQLSSRLIPSIIGDLAKATDSKERKAEKGVQGVQAKIPGLRQKLPVKKDVFGREKKGRARSINTAVWFPRKERQTNPSDQRD
jgi:hypothetical protein